MNLNRFAPIAIAATLALASAGSFAKSAAEWQALTGQSKVTLDQAMEKAAAAGSGTVVDIELDKGDAADARYEAEVVNAAGERVEIYVNAATGEAVTHKQKGKAKSSEIKRMKEAKITMVQAIAAALKSSAGTPVGAELDNNWGKASYDVDVLQQDGSLMKVKIDAVNSSVIRSKKGH